MSVPLRPSVPDYELLRQIGSGSYGEVWLARNLMGRFRAVKIVYRQSFEDSRPFEREFAGIKKYESISRSHESLVTIFHTGRNEAAGCFYYAMELAGDAAGATIVPESYSPKTVSSELRRRGRLAASQCIRIGIALANALIHLHRHGLIHRDVKPSNIIFVEDIPKLADIGLVTEAGASRSFVGTQGFVPPEGPGSPQADLFSLGKVLYEISTGKDRNEFPQVPPQWLEEPDHKTLLELNEIILRACEDDPRKRYQSAGEMLADLAILQSGKSVKQLRSTERRLAVLRSALIVAGLLAVISTAAWFWAQSQAAFERENHAFTQRLRQRAETAERRARDQLWSSILAQTRAERRSGQAGARQAALEAVRSGAALQPGSSELRDEAITALAMDDFREVRRIRARDGPAPGIAIGGGFSAETDAGGQLCIKTWPDGAEVARWELLDEERPAYFQFSPDDRYIRVHFENPGAAVYGVDTGQCVLRLRFADASYGCAFGPGDTFAAVDGAGALRIYDLTSGAMVRSYLIGPAKTYLHASPDGQRFSAFAANSHQVSVFDWATGELVAELDHDPDCVVFDADWSPDGRVLATSASDFKAHLWDVDAASLTGQLEGHTAEVIAAAFHPDGQILVTTSWDGTTKLWNWRLAKPVATGRNWGWDLYFSREGNRLFQRVAAMGAVVVYEVNVSSVSRVISEPFPASDLGNSKGPWHAAFNPDERVLASASYDGVRLSDARTGAALAYLPVGKSHSIAWLPGEAGLVTFSPRGLERWPIKSSRDHELILGPPLILRATDDTGYMAADRSGQTLAIGAGPKMELIRADGSVWSRQDHHDVRVEISPDGKWLTSAVRHHPGLRLWDTTKERLVREFDLGSNARSTFRPDSRQLAASDGEAIWLWDLEGTQPLWRLPREHTGGRGGPVAFASHGTLLAAATSLTGTALIDLATGQVLATLEHPDRQLITGLAFSPSDSMLAVVCETHQIQLWNVGKLRLELQGLNLDWAAPPLPKAISPAGPVSVRVEDQGQSRGKL